MTHIVAIGVALGFVALCVLGAAALLAWLFDVVTETEE